MSYGRVFHIGCPGEFIYDLNRGYVCNKCSALWDGRDWGKAEYRPDPAEAELERMKK